MFHHESYEDFDVRNFYHCHSHKVFVQLRYCISIVK